jgi:hypothetical protein
MKKILLFVTAIFITTSFFACSDDDKNEENSIVGKWEYTHLTGYDNGVIVVDKDIPKDDEPMHYLTFNSNGTWTEEYPNSGHTSKGTYSISGDKLTKIYHDDKDDGYTEQSVIEMMNSTTLNIIDIDEEDGYDGKEIRTYKRI